MKKILALFAILFSSTCLFAQTGFNWEYSDTVLKSKYQLFRDARSFINSNHRRFESLKAVSDRNRLGGTIRIRDTFAIDKNASGTRKYKFVYDLIVTIENNKYRIEIKNMTCDFYLRGEYMQPIFLGENYPESGGRALTRCSKSKYADLIQNMKIQVDFYLNRLKDHLEAPSKEISIPSNLRFTFDSSIVLKKSTNQLFLDTKIFVAENWKMAKEVIDVEDKNGTFMLVKSLTDSENKCGKFRFEYCIKFYFKDGAVRVQIDNVRCKALENETFKSPILLDSEYPFMLDGLGIECFEDEILNAIVYFQNDSKAFISKYLKQISSQSIQSMDW